MNTANYIALTAALIAFFALLLTIYQAYATRQHNMLSVRPFLRIHVDRCNGLCYTLENHGLGPGLLASFILTIDSKKYINPSHEELEAALSIIDIGSGSLAYFTYEYHCPVPGAAYRLGTKLNLLEFTAKDVAIPPGFYDLLESKIEVQVLYQSIYKEGMFKCWA